MQKSKPPSYKAPKPPKTPKRYTTPQSYNFSLTLPGLIGWCLGFIVVLSCFFALGVVVGRGYRPEKAMPRLAGIISAPENATSMAQGPDTVLKPEELDYMERLKDEPGHGGAGRKARAAEIKDGEAETPADEQEAAETAPDGEAGKAQAALNTPDPDDARAESASTEKKAASAATTAEPAPPPDPGEGVFDYIYQTASFRDRQRADEFRERIRTLGLTPDIQEVETSSGQWFRVVVLFHGAPSQTAYMKERLSTLGVDKPIMLSKVPAQ